MKLKILTVSLVVLGFLAACTQRTCPTYAKDTIDKAKKVEEVSEKV